jgi:hypothetical protein
MPKEVKTAAKKPAKTGVLAPKPTKTTKPKPKPKLTKATKEEAASNRCRVGKKYAHWCPNKVEFALQYETDRVCICKKHLEDPKVIAAMS